MPIVMILTICDISLAYKLVDRPENDLLKFTLMPKKNGGLYRNLD